MFHLPGILCAALRSGRIQGSTRSSETPRSPEDPYGSRTRSLSEATHTLKRWDSVIIKSDFRSWNVPDLFLRFGKHLPTLQGIAVPMSCTSLVPALEGGLWHLAFLSLKCAGTSRLQSHTTGFPWNILEKLSIFLCLYFFAFCVWLIKSKVDNQ